MYQLNPNLKAFWKTRKPYKLLKGGRFSSKTQDAGGMAAFLARNYSIKFLCIRQFQNRISDSVYTVIKEKIEQAGWSDEFDIGVSTIKHKKTGSEFLFYGMARNINDIKGTEGVDICWIEEGEALTKEQWAVIDPTIRKEGSEIWLLWNPRFQSDFVQSELPSLLGDDCVIRHINYDENPFLSDTARQKAERLKKADEDEYKHIYLGEALTDDDSVIIKRSWLDAALDAHIKLGINLDGENRIGYDVADSGKDKNADVLVCGNTVKMIREWKGQEHELFKSCAKVWRLAQDKNAHVQYDSIGVGAGCGSNFKNINEEAHGFGRGADNAYTKYTPFNAGGSVEAPDAEYKDGIKNKDFFSNVKAQAWWTIADRLKETYNAVVNGEEYDPSNIISVSSECENVNKLLVELSTPKRHFDGKGKVKVESKEDLAKRDIDSPNLADAFIMALWRPVVTRPTIRVGRRRR